MSSEDLNNTEYQEKLTAGIDAAAEDEIREVADEQLEEISGGWPNIRTPMPIEPESKIV